MLENFCNYEKKDRLYWFYWRFSNIISHTRALYQWRELFQKYYIFFSYAGIFYYFWHFVELFFGCRKEFWTISTIAHKTAGYSVYYIRISGICCPMYYSRILWKYKWIYLQNSNISSTYRCRLVFNCSVFWRNPVLFYSKK